jgi:hypothetical protein
LVFFATAQDKQYKMGVVAFYNLENLFDTIDSPNTNDAEFLPNGANKWNTAKYYEKLNNMAKAISVIGPDERSVPPAIIGLCEIENRLVLDDLVKQEPLKPYNYQIVHYDSPDRRGVDVALLFRPTVFKVTSSRSVTVKYPNDTSFRTRDQLVVSGLFDGDTMHIIVMHWPSRRGGEASSKPLRFAAAMLTRSIADSILNLNPNAGIIVMGDLNDNPNDDSLIKKFKASGSKTNLKPGEFYNPYYDLYKKGKGSNAYRDAWSNFDQIIVSQGLLGQTNSYNLYKAAVFNKPFLTQAEGQFKGYPFRTFSYGNYIGGYSDHYPVYILLIKQVN